MKRLKEPFIVPHQHKQIFLSTMQFLEWGKTATIGDDSFNDILIKNSLIPEHSVLVDIIDDESKDGKIYKYIC